MIERHVTFEMFPEKADQFVAFFNESYQPAMSKSEGFVSVALLVEMERPERYQMVIRFKSVEDSENWRASEAHKTLSPILKSFYSASSVVVYRVVA